MTDLSKEELAQLSNLLLSEDDDNTHLAFEMMKEKPFSEELITELFVVCKLSSNEEFKKHAEAELLRLDSNMKNVLSLKQKLSRDGFNGANEKTITKNINHYVYKSNDKLDGVKLAKALIKKYGHGYQFLLDNLEGDDLIEFLSSFIDVNKFSFTNKGVSKIPKEIFQIPGIDQIEELDMSGNKIGSVPAQIGKLTNLKRLNLDSNNLKSVNKNIVKCTQLKELDLSNNNFKDFPEIICSCNSLEKLYMINASSYFSDVYFVPKTFPELTNLKVLYFHRQRVEQATNLYKIFAQCESLEELDLSKYQEKNPSKIKELQSALPNCKITTSEILSKLNYN